jgi:hypothetical protein
MEYLLLTSSIVFPSPPTTTRQLTTTILGTQKGQKNKKKKGRRISCAVQRASKTKDNDPFLPVQSWNLSNTKTIRTSSHHNPFSPLVVGFPCEKLEPICREENSDTRTLHDLSSSPAFKSYHAIISINNSQ